jgi:RNA polymerase sigma factor (sigma-70 family)
MGSIYSSADAGVNAAMDALTPVTHEEFAEAYRVGFPVTARLLMKKGLTSDLAVEISQTAWMKAWEHLAQLRNRDSLLPWVRCIALNHLRTFVNRSIKWETLENVAAVHPAVTARVESERILERCNEKQRTLLTRYYLEGLTTGDIAKQDGCSELAIRLKLCRARKSAQQGLSG